MYKRNIVLEYFHTFTRNFNLTHAIWMLVLGARGFTLFQLGIFEGVFHVTSLSMEIPTGAIADLYGRKVSRMLGITLNIVYLSILAFSDNFWLVVVGFVFCALSYTMESGAGDALVYDSLLEDGRKDHFKNVNGYKEIIFQVASLLSAFVGGAIAEYNHSLVFKLAIAVAVVSFTILSFQKETTVDKHPDGIKSKFKEQYIESFKFVLKDKRLLLLMIIGSLFAFPVTVLFFYSQVYFEYLGYSEIYIGAFLAFSNLTAIIGAYLVTKIHIKDKYIFTIIPIFMLVILWTYANSFAWVSLAVLSFFETILYIVILNHMNHLIPAESSNKRATIISISSMMFSVLMIIVFPVVGYLADIYTYEVGFMFNASIASLGYLIYLLTFRKVNA